MIPSDYYVIARYGTQVNPAFTPKIVRHIMEDYFGVLPTDEEIAQWLKLSHDCKMKAQVEALSHLGLSQTDIAILVGISQPSVSNHLKNPSPNPYLNMDFTSKYSPYSPIFKDNRLSIFKDTILSRKQEFDNEYTLRIPQTNKVKSVREYNQWLLQSNVNK